MFTANTSTAVLSPSPAQDAKAEDNKGGSEDEDKDSEDEEKRGRDSEMSGASEEEKTQRRMKMIRVRRKRQ